MRAAFLTLALIAAAMNSVRADELPLLYSDEFESGMDRWQSRDAEGAEPSFKIVEVKGFDGKTTHALRAMGTSKYAPKFRSPPNFVLLNDVIVGDFEITAETQNTRPDAGGHRDMCIFWGYQDPTHFYYVHFGAKPDPHAGQIFIVNDAERLAITKNETQTPWTLDWHKVKVTRNVADGQINVYFDDMDKPMMQAKDDRFKWGQVGLGTFDDHGHWDNFVLRGMKVEAPKKDAAAK